jgi:hypothetical protein
LDTAVGVVDKPAAMDRSPIMKCLVESIEHKARMGSRARPPADIAVGEGVDHEAT